MSCLNVLIIFLYCNKVKIKINLVMPGFISCENQLLRVDTGAKHLPQTLIFQPLYLAT